MNVKGTATYVNGRIVTELKIVPPEGVPVVLIPPAGAQLVSQAPPSARPEYQRHARAVRDGKSQSLAGGALERFVQAEMEKYRAVVILFFNPQPQALN